MFHKNNSSLDHKPSGCVIAGLILIRLSHLLPELYSFTTIINS